MKAKPKNKEIEQNKAKNFLKAKKSTYPKAVQKKPKMEKITTVTAKKAAKTIVAAEVRDKPAPSRRDTPGESK